MASAQELPREIQVERLAGGVRYRFPRRRLKGLRAAALLMIVFGLAACAFLLFWEDSLAGVLRQRFGAPGLVVGLIHLLEFIGSCGPIAMGLALLYGHTDVVVHDGRVCWTERVGPFHRTRCCAAGGIRRLVIETANSERKPAVPGTGFNVFVLKAQMAGGKSSWLAFAYPRAWLLALSRQLAADCRAAAVAASGTAAPPVEVVDLPVVEAVEVDRLEQPADSPVVYERFPDGLTLDVPARGLKRGSAGLFVFSLVWCGCMVFFTAAVLVGLRGNPWMKDLLGPLATLLGLLWAVGLGMMVAAVNMGRRRAALAVTDGSLLVLQTSLFGSKRHAWQQAEIQSVGVGPSGLVVNDRPVLQLQIVPLEGKPVGMLAGHDVAELEWLATQVRRALWGRARGVPTGPL